MLVEYCKKTCGSFKNPSVPRTLEVLHFFGGLYTVIDFCTTETGCGRGWDGGDEQYMNNYRVSSPTTAQGLHAGSGLSRRASSRHRKCAIRPQWSADAWCGRSCMLLVSSPEELGVQMCSMGNAAIKESPKIPHHSPSPRSG